MADRVSASYDTATGSFKGISQTVPDNILAGGLKRAAGDVTIEAGGANTVILRANGTTTATITSTGLGVGTSTPDSKVEIVSTTSQLRLTHTDAAEYGDWSTTVIGATGNYLQWVPASAAGPYAGLGIERASSGSTVELYTSNSSNTSDSHAQLGFYVAGTAAGNPQLFFNIPGGTDWIVGPDNDQSDAFTFSTGSVLGTNNRLVIQADGSVGIGVSTPDRKVEILDTAGAQLRLTYTDASVFTDIRTESTGDLSFAPSNNRVTIGTPLSSQKGFHAVLANSAGGVTIQARNTDNTAAAFASCVLTVGGTSALDPYTYIAVTGSTEWSYGLDNDDADSFVFSEGGGLGTNNRFRIATGGAASFSSTLTVSGKVITTSTTTTPAILIGSFTADPSGLTNGDVWYDSTANKFRAREAGVSVNMISAGTASGWTDDGAEIRLTTSTDEVTVGAAGGTAGKFTVVGDTIGQKTIVAKQVASQTAAALTIQNSAGTDLHTVSGTTSISYFYTTTVSAVTSQTQDESAGGGSSAAFNFTTGIGGDASGGAGGSGGSYVITLGQAGNAGSASGSETAGTGGGFQVIGGQGGTGDTAGTGGLNGGSGGVFTIRSGAGGTAGSGGAAGYGGALTIQSGDAGTVGSTFGITPGNGGLITVRGGVGSTGDSASFGGIGGSITLIGGIGGYAFPGSSFAAGPGGDVSLTGGIGGDGNAIVAATGGGYIYINGGTGGVNNGGGGGPGGNVVIRGGNATGAQTDGTLSLGDANTSFITLGATSIVTTVNGPIRTTSTTTLAGLRFGSVSGDPSTPSNGDVWYDSTAGKFRAREAGASVDMIGGATGAGWTDDGATVRLTTATDEVAIGTATAFAKLGVLNDNVSQSVIAARCASGQSSDPLVVSTNGGTNFFKVDITGRLTCDAGPSGVTGRMQILAGQSTPGIRWDLNANGSGAADILQTVAGGNPELTVTAGTYIISGSDNTGQIGKSGQRWATGYFGTMVTGDLVMEDVSRDASWRFVEHHEHIEVINQKTGKKYRLALEEAPE